MNKIVTYIIYIIQSILLLFVHFFVKNHDNFNFIIVILIFNLLASFKLLIMNVIYHFLLKFL